MLSTSLLDGAARSLVDMATLYPCVVRYAVNFRMQSCWKLFSLKGLGSTFCGCCCEVAAFPCMLERLGRFDGCGGGGPPSCCLFKAPAAAMGKTLDRRDCLPNTLAAPMLPEALLLSCDGLIAPSVERLMASSSLPLLDPVMAATTHTQRIDGRIRPLFP